MQPTANTVVREETVEPDGESNQSESESTDTSSEDGKSLDDIIEEYTK